ncbi:Squidulin [Dirofilaria immitis]
MLFRFAFLCILQKIVAETGNSIVRFDEIDTDGDRRITFKELKSWHEANHIIKNDKELKEMIQSKDQNNDGMLSIAEFVQLLLMRKPINQNKQIFQRIDKNGDGIITPTEVMTSKDNGISEKIINEIFQLVDLNGDGLITFDEFESTMNGNSNTHQQSKGQSGKNQNLAQQLMTLIDQNLDRNLSVQEVYNFANANIKSSKIEIIKAFGEIDSDHNDFLTINEIIAKLEKMIALVHFKEPPPVLTI